MNLVLKIKDFIKKECQDNSQQVADWFFSEHLEVVDKYAQKLLQQNPEANSEVVELAVWLHDVQRIYNLDGEHALTGAIKSREILKNFNCKDGIIEQVYEAVRTHRANSPETQPATLEGKILATADAMAHFSSNFYLKVFLSKMKKGEFENVQEFKNWAIKKINRDYQNKIFFEEARKIIKSQYQTLIGFFSLN